MQLGADTRRAKADPAHKTQQTRDKRRETRDERRETTLLALNRKSETSLYMETGNDIYIRNDEANDDAAWG